VSQGIRQFLNFQKAITASCLSLRSKLCQDCDARHAKCSHILIEGSLEVKLPTYGQMKSRDGTPLWREAHLEGRMHGAHHVWSTFRSCDVEEVRAVLWRQPHFEVKMYKAHQLRTTFGSWDVEKMHVVVARSILNIGGPRAIFWG